MPLPGLGSAPRPSSGCLSFAFVVDLAGGVVDGRTGEGGSVRSVGRGPCPQRIRLRASGRSSDRRGSFLRSPRRGLRPATVVDVAAESGFRSLRRPIPTISPSYSPSLGRGGTSSRPRGFCVHGRLMQHNAALQGAIPPPLIPERRSAPGTPALPATGVCGGHSSPTNPAIRWERRAAAAAPASSTSVWSIGAWEKPAAQFVTSETPSTAAPR